MTDAANGQAANGQLVGGRYRLGPHLGSGGMGTVWRGHDELLHRDVAVKEVLIAPGLPAPEAARLRERYLREARAAARLRHASVVGVYDVLPEPDRVWIVMEYVNARNLAETLRADGPLSPERAAALGLQILDALDHAHRAGVLHRDVKPANVLVWTDPGEPGERAVLTDFGVASVTGDSSLTRTGHLVGSPAYLSPERLTGGTVGPPSDLWSLGCTLFAAVEGKPPFAREEQFAVITAITLEPVPVASRAGHLAPVLAGLLDKDPDLRWDAVRTRAALKKVADGDAVEPLDAASWGSPPAGDEGPTWWMPAEAPSNPPLPLPHTPMPTRMPTAMPTPSPGAEPTVVRQRPAGPAAPAPPLHYDQPARYASPVSAAPGSTPPNGWQGNFGNTPTPEPTSAPPSFGPPSFGPPPGPPQAERGGGSRLGLWLVAAIVVVVLAGGAGVYAKRSGLLGGGGTAAGRTPSAPVATTGAPSPTTSTAGVFNSDEYQLSYPTDWKSYCLTDPAEVKAQGFKGCYFDKIPDAEHTDTSKVLRSSPYVLVIVGTADGTPKDQLIATEDDAAKQGSFPNYQRVELTDNVTYGSHTGAVLEYTYYGTAIPKYRVRIFRFEQNSTYYEVSLRSPETGYDSFLGGFKQVASSIQPR